MGSCLDLREYQDETAIMNAYSKLVSGRSNYKSVIERRKDPVKCPNCGKVLEEGTKFCPECGTKIEVKQKLTKCPNASCSKPLSGEEKFCINCGAKIE